LGSMLKKTLIFYIVIMSLCFAANKNFYLWETKDKRSLDKGWGAYFTFPDRVGFGQDKTAKYAFLKKNAFQCPFNIPAFDFDPKNYGALNNLFYMKVRFKDTVTTPVNFYAWNGGTGFYGTGYIGALGGSGDNEWKEETLVIPLSIMRCGDGKYFKFSNNVIVNDFPIGSILLFSSAAEGLANKDALIKEAFKTEAEKRTALKNSLRKNFTDLGLPAPGKQPEYTPAEKSRGLRYFFPPVSRQLFSNSEPNPIELSTEAKLAACPGEFETLVLALRAVGGPKKISLEFSDCVKESAKLETSKAPIRFAEYNEQRSGSSWGKEYQVVTERLLPESSKELTPERLELCYITVKVPEEAAPGEYSGKITMTFEKGEKTEIPVKFTVYPFRLEHPEHGTHALYYYNNYGGWNPFEFADMRDHGMDAIVGDFTPLVTVNSDGSLTADEAPIKEFFAAAKTFGFQSPLITGLGSIVSMTKKDPVLFGKAIQKTMDLASAGGFPEILFFPVDEPHDAAKIKLSLELCTLIKKTPGAKTYITLNPTAEPTLEPVLDYHCYNITYLNEETLKKPGLKGHTLMYYGPNIATNPTPVRYTSGYYFYKSGAKAVHFFTYMLFFGDPLVDFDGPNRDWNVVFPSLTSTTHDPTVEWESQREGVDDYKYLYTLEQTIKRAEKAGRIAEAKKAQAVLDSIMKDVSPDGKKATGPETYIEANTALKDKKIDTAVLKGKVGQTDDSWYDRSRKKIAEQIIELNNSGK